MLMRIVGTSEDLLNSLQRVFHLSSELGKVEFPLIVKSSTGYDVIPVNPPVNQTRNSWKY